MIALLVYQSADSKYKKSVSHRKESILNRWERIVDYNNSEILDINVKRIDKEELCVIAKRIGGVEYRRHIHKKHSKYAPEILHIAEEYEERRKYKSYSDIEDNKTNDGDKKRKKSKCKGNAVNYAEDKEHGKSKTEIDKRGNISRKQEKIFRHVYLSEYRSVCHKRAHTARGSVIEKAEHYISAEKIDGIMLHISAEKVLEHNAHYEKRKQRRNQAPEHAEVGSFIFFLEIALDKLREKKAVFLEAGQRFIQTVCLHFLLHLDLQKMMNAVSIFAKSIPIHNNYSISDIVCQEIKMLCQILKKRRADATPKTLGI